MKRYQLLLSLLLLSQLAFTQDFEISDEDRLRYGKGCMGNEDCITAKVLQYSGRGYESIKVFWPVIHLAKETKNWSLYLNCVSNVVYMYGGGDNYQIGIDLAYEALNLIQTEAPEYEKDCFWIYSSLMYIYEKNHDHKKEHEVVLQGVELLLKYYPKDHPLFIRAYTNLGSSYATLGQIDKVLDCYMKSREIFESSPNPNKYEGIHNYHCISSYYFEIGNFELAIEYIEKTIELSVELFGANDYQTFPAYLDLGHYLELQKEYARSLEYYEKAYYMDNLQHTTGDELRFGNTLNIHFSLAGLYLQTDQLEEALDYYTKILALLGDRKEKWVDQANAILGIASVQYQHGDLDKALGPMSQPILC